MVQFMLGGGVYSHVKEYRDVLPKRVSVLPKFLKQGSHFSQEILRRGFHFTKIVNVRSAIFEAEKPLKMGPDSHKIGEKSI